MTDITKTPYAEYLEETISIIMEHKPVGICFAALLDDGSTLTSYYDADASVKALMVHNIQNDITMDVIENNIDYIRDLLAEEEDSE